MEEIKVGEYVRTKDGRIIKFNKFGTLRVGCRNPIYYKTIISNRKHYKYNNIVKHSFNIIDLIECGDYVNGIKIISITQQADTMKTISLCGFDNDYLDIKLNNRDIKTVVTKEQFNSIKYVLEE